MLDTELLNEIQIRDFLSKKDHFSKYKNIKSEKIWGNYIREVPLVTIVMPIYNHPVKCFERALQSAINQKGDINYQIIVVDNNSDDNNVNEIVVRKMQSNKIVYFRNQKNIGMFGNWNRCISLAKTEWITFLHSDDMLKENFLKTMCSIVTSHKEIDQLACNYSKYNANLFDENQINYIRKEENLNHTLVRSIDVSEYFDHMITSVKGAFIKKKKIIEIGGFRDLGDGLGASDYTTMLKYAYYYKTYLLNANLYLNGWGENETLNLSHWYPELVANYYMQCFFNKSGNSIKRYLNKCRYINILLYRVDTYNSGKNFSGKVISVNVNELLTDCNIKKLSNRNYYRLIGKGAGLIKKIKLRTIQKRFRISN